MCATCIVHLTLLLLIILNIAQEYKLGYKHPHYAVLRVLCYFLFLMLKYSPRHFAVKALLSFL